jgi:dTDP-4-dehydrorhamnose 3,5-epimerase
MGITIKATRLTGPLIITPVVHRDERGFFCETYNQKDFQEATGLDVQFVQDNWSQSKKSVLRGLHYQLKYPQGRLIRVTKGEIFDVSVNLQRGHREFGRWAGVLLSDTNCQQLWIPPGFGHGFLALSDSADIVYKTTEYFHPEQDRNLAWNDPDIAIDWPLVGDPILSTRDAHAQSFKDAELYD